MKNLFSLLAATLFFLTASAQEQNNSSQRIQEVGLAFSSLNSFGLVYRIGNEKSVWRFNASLFGGNNQGNDNLFSNSKNSSIGLRLSTGKEFRKQIIDKLEFRYGVGLLYRYQSESLISDFNNINGRNSYSLNEFTTNEIGVEFIVGVNYELRTNLWLGVEINPFITYFETDRKYVFQDDFRDDQSSDFTTGNNYGLSNNFA